MSATVAFVIACDTPACPTSAVLPAPSKRAARRELARAGWTSRRDAVVENDPRPAAIVDRCPACARPAATS